jgi:tRNA-(ms[2]io[6]A)-hydroxylase
MLGLLTPTDRSWVERVEGDLDGLLSDHAHCEMKAAQNALALVGRHACEFPEMVEPLMALAREESEHFGQVYERLRARSRVLEVPRPDDYVGDLRRIARADAGDTPILLDRLLVAALIEARSCERFKVLAEELSSAELRAFYKDLMVSEARHFRLFSSLAGERFGVQEARTRLADLATREAAIASRLPLGPTVHG